MTTPVDIDAVLRAAEKATAHEWLCRRRDGFLIENKEVEVATIPDYEGAENDAAYIIAACNSAVAMAEEIRVLRAENERVNELNDALYERVKLLTGERR